METMALFSHREENSTDPRFPPQDACMHARLLHPLINASRSSLKRPNNTNNINSFPVQTPLLTKSSKRSQHYSVPPFGAAPPGFAGPSVPVPAAAVPLLSAPTIFRSSHSLVNSWFSKAKSWTSSRQACMSAARGVRVPSVWMRRMNRLGEMLDRERLKESIMRKG